jgi:GntR family transcriptional regulator
MKILVDLNRPEPAWQQVVHGVLDQLAGGHLEVGAQLESVRVMAKAVRLNPNTVARAYRELEVLGVVVGRQGRGVFVTADGPRVARRERGGALKDAIRAAVQRAREGGLEDEQIRKAVEAALKKRRPSRKERKEQA